MRLTFKQKLLSFLDSYDVYDGNGNIYFRVKSKLDFGHNFIIYNSHNEEVGRLKQKVLCLFPEYTIYKGYEKLGIIKKEITFFRPKFHVSFGGYTVEGNFLEWDYDVYKYGRKIASISKQLFNLTDTYMIDVEVNEALIVLMIVLAIDSIKDNRSQHGS